MSTAKTLEHKTPSQLAAHTAKWAVIMAKVAIRQAIADNPCPHWHILSFTGPAGSESRGLVDLIAIRKDHGKPLPGTKLGDALQIILIQAKGVARRCQRRRTRSGFESLPSNMGLAAPYWRPGKRARQRSSIPCVGIPRAGVAGRK